MALYFARTGARATPLVHSWSKQLYSGAEINHIGRWLRQRYFSVYANSHFGGICWTCHSAKSWHYLKDETGYSLALDIGTPDPRVEYTRIKNEVVPLLNRVGIGWMYSLNGHVTNHDDHIHIDAGTYGYHGGGRNQGYFLASRKESVYNVFRLSGTGETRKPRTVQSYRGQTGARVRVAQRAMNHMVASAYRIEVDGSFGSDTQSLAYRVQRNMGIVRTGKFDHRTARHICYLLGTQSRGKKNPAVGIIQLAVLPDVKGIDNSFGPATERWVKAAQRYKGLSPDGYFGYQSRQNILV